MATQEKKIQAENCPPTWEAVVRIYLEIWDKQTPEWKYEATQELVRCARMADAYVKLKGQEEQDAKTD